MAPLNDSVQNNTDPLDEPAITVSWTMCPYVQKWVPAAAVSNSTAKQLL